ncbi:MAG: Fic family protein, partial [Candidatus Sumerlaeota bacterium]|nr:Fic family protein [Candidatus Sumerlaeota bacterium]
MKRGPSGKYLTIATVGECCRAFVPDALPPKPPLEVSPGLRDKMDQALLALGRLDSLTLLLPDPSLFLYMYVRKEAVLSSQIEGTQSSLSDLLLFELEEAPGVPLDDVREVSNHVAALEHGLARLRGDFPLSLRLIRDIHKVLLKKGRGEGKSPGEFRRSQNWIGGTRPGNAVFVPPPPDRLTECLGSLEMFLHDRPVRSPILIKAALAHAQFETIHPFLDGNGRIGRLLITLLLNSEGVLREPLLYLSLYFKRYRKTYYDLLQAIRVDGDWESWVEFFVTAVGDTAHEAVETIRSLEALSERHRKVIRGMGRLAGSALQIHAALLRNPLITIPKAAEKTGLSPNTVTSCLKHLEKIAIVREITRRRRSISSERISPASIDLRSEEHT